eukprot:15697274-Heterocapsa_arctica.AAC.1
MRAYAVVPVARSTTTMTRPRRSVDAGSVRVARELPVSTSVRPLLKNVWFLSCSTNCEVTRRR